MRKSIKELGLQTLKCMATESMKSTFILIFLCSETSRVILKQIAFIFCNIHVN